VEVVLDIVITLTIIDLIYYFLAPHIAWSKGQERMLKSELYYITIISLLYYIAYNLNNLLAILSE